MASRLKPEELVHILNEIFAPWDRLCERYGVEKIKTIGDCYMAVAGIAQESKGETDDHAKRMVEFAMAALAELNRLNTEKILPTPIKFRVGIHSGPCVSGVIGVTKFAFDVSQLRLSLSRFSPFLTASFVQDMGRHRQHSFEGRDGRASRQSPGFCSDVRRDPTCQIDTEIHVPWSDPTEGKGRDRVLAARRGPRAQGRQYEGRQASHFHQR